MSRNKPILYVDLETWSELDITKCGTVKYCQNADIMLAGFKLGDKYEDWDHNDKVLFPKWVSDHITDGGTVVAHNALFEFCMLKPIFTKLKLDQMVDTMALCAAASLPLSLDKAGEALNLSQDKKKLKIGKRLITKFCIPRKPTKNNPSTRNTRDTHPKDWKQFKEDYLRMDIVSMEAIHSLLPPLIPEEHISWVDTQIINLSGIPIDTDTVKLITSKLDTLVDEESSKFIRLTGIFPTQRQRVLDWVNGRGLKLPNLQAETIKEVLKKDIPKVVREALVARANTSHMSFKKYKTMKDAVCDDGSIKGTLCYHAAGTGRWGGRLLQPHNLTKGEVDGEEAVDRIQSGDFSVELVKSAVRPMIYHPYGFTVVDYSSIEARIVQWVANDQLALQIFRDGGDPYIHMASRIYGVAYKEVTSKQRFTGKQAILGLGFQMSAKKFIQMVEGYGETISEQEATMSVKIYRDIHRKLVIFWRDIGNAAVKALQMKGTTIRLNNIVEFVYEGDFLYMVLPSGRRLAYYKPQLGHSPWGGASLSYMSMNSKNQFVRVSTYGGKLTENLVQAVARDILNTAIHTLMDKGFCIVTHIHDEVVVLRKESLDEIIEIMCEIPEWALGLPIKAEGKTVNRYKKI